MPRPLRFIPEPALVEITTRTLQGRLLLRPSPELIDTERLRARAREIRDMFPLWAFPPQLPFKEAA